MSNKRKDKNKKLPPRYQLEEQQLHEQIEVGGIGKNMLLLVEGDTEEAYFERLKQNLWLNGNLAGVKIEKIEKRGGIYKIYDEAKASKETNQLWIVFDNDKRNAYVLEKKEDGKIIKQPFFNLVNNEKIPQSICIRLRDAYDSDKHNYFLSTHDYLLWLSNVIGTEDTLEYWDRIHYLTIKNWLKIFEKYDETKDAKVSLAYSCIAFEFWLILHFEQNKNPFLWVDKGKDETIDVVTYLRTLKPDYEKGIHKPCNAYTCLYDDFNKSYPAREDDWQVLVRIFKAIKNAEWLRYEMSPILNRQSGKWYEVNPYVKGIDDLMKDLLNIKPLNEPINFSDLTVQFSFDIQNARLTFQIAVNDGNVFEINQSQRSCFLIKDASGNSLEPNIEEAIEFPNQYEPIIFQYNIPQLIEAQLVLIFKDPRPHSKSNQLFFLLN